jgi:hypothetical protein
LAEFYKEAGGSFSITLHVLIFKEEAMPKPRRSLMTTLVSFFFVVILLGCGTAPPVAQKATPSPTMKLLSTPTPMPMATLTSIPMVRITVQLVDVYCAYKQNVFGYHDQFYMMTAFVAPDVDPKAQPHPQALLSLPLDITNKQDLNLPQSYLLVFDGLVPQQGAVIGGFTAYNYDKKHKLTWENINEWTSVRFSPYSGNLGQLMLHKHNGGLSFTDRFES